MTQPHRTGTNDWCCESAVSAARHQAVIERRSLERLAASAVAPAAPWSGEERSLLIDLLLTGRAAIPIIEALDQRGVWVGILPEWAAVRARPQHNAYHQFTVDRHLLETAANAAQLASRVERPDLLVLAALFHDLGKGYAGDHSETGVALARDIAIRMGYEPDDVATMAALVGHHLLLVDVATRRDLDDPATIEHVAEATGSMHDARAASGAQRSRRARDRSICLGAMESSAGRAAGRAGGPSPSRGRPAPYRQGPISHDRPDGSAGRPGPAR